MGSSNLRVEDSDDSSSVILRDGASDDFSRQLIDIDQRVASGQPVADIISAGLFNRDQQELVAAAACLQLLNQLREKPPDSSRELQGSGLSAEERNAIPSGAPTVDAPQQTFGRFELRRFLGQGGFGIVFLAFDPKFNQEVALKLPRLDRLTVPQFRRRFLQEGRAAAGLNHPNIVSAHEAGEWGGICYLAMTYCEGKTLTEYLSQQLSPLKPLEAAGLVADLADGVEYAHQRGILHRDLKPSNILLQQVGNTENGDDALAENRRSPFPYAPKITDFGIAKFLDDEVTQTQSGMAVGTPAYMAPEQIQATIGAISPATDVYALGAILFEALTLNRPFNSVSPMDVSWQIVNRPAPSPRSLRREIPLNLASICLKCLEKEPQRRYVSATALRDDLRNYSRGLPIQARAPGLIEKSWNWARRNPLVAMLSALIMLISTCLVSASIWHSWTIATKDSELRQLASLAKTKEEHAQVLDSAASINNYVFQTRLANELFHNGQHRLMADVLNRARPGANQKDLRDFCWKYLWRIAQQERDFSLGKYSARRVALSGDGRVLAAICMDRTVRAWDLGTGDLLCTQGDFVYEPRAIAVSADGSLIAASSPGRCEWCGELRLWMTRTNEILHELRGIGFAEGAITFLPNSTTLALPLRSLLHDGQLPKYLPVHPGVLLLWDYETNQRRILCEGQLRASAVAVSNDGKTVAVACQARHDTQMSIWLIDATEGNSRVCIPSGMPEIESLDFSLDGSTIVANARGQLLRLWDVETGTSILIPATDPSIVRDAVFFGADRRLMSFAATHNQPQIQLLTDASTGNDSSATLAIHDSVSGATRALNGKTIAWWGDGSTIHLRQPDAVSTCQRLSIPFQEIAHVTRSPVGAIRVVGRAGRELAIWEEDETILRVSPNVDAGFLNDSLVVSPDGARIATWNDGNVITLRNLPAGDSPQQLTESTTSSDLVAFSDDCKFLAHAQRDGHIIVRNLDDGVVQSMFQNPASPIRGMALSVDGKLLVTAGSAGGIDLWHTQGGNLLSRYFEAPVATHMVFTPDSRFVITVSQDGMPRIWGVFAESQREFLGGHPQEVTAMAVSPDGRTLATGANDQSVRLWYIPTGNQLLSMDHVGGKVSHLAFSRDGSRLAAVLTQGNLLIWNSQEKFDRETKPARAQ